MPSAHRPHAFWDALPQAEAKGLLRRNYQASMFGGQTCMLFPSFIEELPEGGAHEGEGQAM